MLEILKLISSIATPLTIAFVGILINKRIQEQATLTQRQLSWRGKWAENFLQQAEAFNTASVDCLMCYYEAVVLRLNNSPEAQNKLETLHTRVFPLFMEMERSALEVRRHAAFATQFGQRVVGTCDALLDEVRGWMREKEVHFDEFLQKSSAFNLAVRDAHAELLGLEPSVNNELS